MKTKKLKCSHCGRPIKPDHKFDKDGFPVCDGCWEVEEEQLAREDFDEAQA